MCIHVWRHKKLQRHDLLKEMVNQMHDLSSTVSYSPSFSYYASGEFAAAAVKVSRENQSYNLADTVNDEDGDFEFETSPLHEETLVHFPTFPNDVVFVINNKDEDVEAVAVNKSESFSGNCLWSPLRSPKRSELSSSTPKRCRLKKLLTRSHSASKRCYFKEFMRRSHSDGGDASKKSSPAVKAKDKTASYKAGEEDKRRKSYLPYRQDLIGVFAGIRGLRRS